MYADFKQTTNKACLLGPAIACLSSCWLFQRFEEWVEEWVFPTE